MIVVDRARGEVQVVDLADFEPHRIPRGAIVEALVPAGTVLHFDLGIVSWSVELVWLAETAPYRRTRKEELN